MAALVTGKLSKHCERHRYGLEGLAMTNNNKYFTIFKMGTNFQAKVSKAKLLPEKDFLKNRNK
jgi:hypothetical protein